MLIQISFFNFLAVLLIPQPQSSSSLMPSSSLIPYTTPSATLTPPTTSESSDDGLSTGAIVGIIVGIFVGALALTILTIASYAWLVMLYICR